MTSIIFRDLEWFYFYQMKLPFRFQKTQSFLFSNTNSQSNQCKHILFLNRSSRQEVFCKKGVVGNFTKFTGKHLCQSLLFNKVAGLYIVSSPPHGISQAGGQLLNFKSQSGDTFRGGGDDFRQSSRGDCFIMTNC